MIDTVEKQLRVDTFPRYELHPSAGGVQVVYFAANKQGQMLSTPIGMWSVGRGLSAINKHAKRKMWPLKHDEVCGWIEAPEVIKQVR